VHRTRGKKVCGIAGLPNADPKEDGHSLSSLRVGFGIAADLSAKTPDKKELPNTSGFALIFRRRAFILLLEKVWALGAFVAAGKIRNEKRDAGKIKGNRQCTSGKHPRSDPPVKLTAS
jgi:hypothetical protein